MSDPILQVEGISKGFPGVQALKDVHLEVHILECLHAGESLADAFHLEDGITHSVTYSLEGSVCRLDEEALRWTDLNIGSILYQHPLRCKLYLNVPNCVLSC